MGLSQGSVGLDSPSKSFSGKQIVALLITDWNIRALRQLEYIPHLIFINCVKLNNYNPLPHLTMHILGVAASFRYCF